MKPPHTFSMTIKQPASGLKSRLRNNQAHRYQLTPAHAEVSENKEMNDNLRKEIDNRADAWINEQEESENEMNEEQIDINAAKDVYVLTDSNGIYEFRVMDKDEFETAQQQANFASDGNIYWELYTT